MLILQPRKTPPTRRESWCRREGWIPHPGQSRVLRRRERFIGAVWGVRGGKSTLAAQIACAEASVPGHRVWCVGPTHDLAQKVYREVWERFRALGTMLPGSSNTPQHGRIVLPMGGFIERKTADNPNSLVGEALDAVILDEASRCKRTIWERELRPRLSDRRGRALIITTPNGQDWIYDAFTAWEKGMAPDWWWTSAPTWENSAVFPGGRDDPEIVAASAYYESLGLEAMFAQEYGARFEIIRGRVFKRYDKRKAVVKHAVAAANVSEWYLGFDWGFVHPSVCILIGRAGRQPTWRVLDEDYGTGETWDEILTRAKDIVARNNLTPESLDGLMYDPSRPEMGVGFRRAGFPAKAADYGLAERILATGEAIAGGMLISERCRRLAVELAMYRHPDDCTSGKLRVVKVDDDGVDALAGVLATIAKRERRGGLAVAYAH